ncbi:hypothetical protein FP371_24575 [Citrobacter freundii]|uniref:hypothetical protein n=1 Tax=Enterobacteriaceae TaxID=543 RepID=UPI0005CF9851|nr:MULTISPECIES: hypothetical protein [Enterobacteriaceae]EEA2350441.1 hypothetical protein [Salmonella enterica subsp. enterica serovar Enteritidis]EEC4304219.1 hypothetical protein [Salmonella enterica subsp. enterica serovar Enteritidis]EEN2406643.1 hypothetical protein [Salmonella enterica subsp. enterica serovar Enteritidis]EES8921259.1 hypothetical protein [Escherichia coli]EES9862667.1 hypothetical protein [Escherichia coli]
MRILNFKPFSDALSAHPDRKSVITAAYNFINSHEISSQANLRSLFPSSRMNKTDGVWELELLAGKLYLYAKVYFHSGIFIPILITSERSNFQGA